MSKSPERTSLSAQEAHHIRYGMWLASVEQLFLSVRSSTSQFVGFTSPKPRSGVTTIAGALSSLSAKAGQKTILLDFSVAPKEQDNKPAWCPGYSDIRQNVTRHHDGYDYLIADATTNSRPLFSNVELLNTSLRGGLQNYDAVFLDLAPVLDRSVYRINPLGPAATCGSVILVCARGRLQRAHAV